MEWIKADDIKTKITTIVDKLQMSHVDPSRIICFRSVGSHSRSRARIWSFPRVWQQALDLPPYYIIEVLSQYFDHLSKDDQIKVLIHELMHIPKTFSGALVPHRNRGGRIDSRSVDKLFQVYVNR